MTFPTEFETAFANVSALVDLAQWHTLEYANRAGDGDAEHYAVPKREGDQLMALLIVTSDYAKRVLHEHDECRRATEGGAV